MNKRLLIIGALLVGVVLFLFFGLGRKKRETNKVFDKSFNVSAISYKPYDCKFFYDEVKKLAKSKFEERKTAFSFDFYKEEKSTYMVVSPYFYPNTESIHQLKNFAQQGNTVFICAFSLSTELADSLFFSTRSDEINIGFPPYLEEKKWSISWHENQDITPYKFPGHQPNVAVLDSIYLLGNNAITDIDTLITDNQNKIQMLKMTCGEGQFFLCNNPILLSNYFLLHKNNYTFFNKVAQKINLQDNHIIWDDYYKNVRSSDSDDQPKVGESAVMKVIMQNQSLRWAFYTFLLGLASFFLIYYRRIQKEVPIYTSLKNNSEAYINVVSGLYWDQQNHKSIADKIISQFFEHLSTNFHLNPKDFHESELEKISQKTGQSLAKIKVIFQEINQVKLQEEISKQNLISLYQKINSFYQD
jgi:hypothetical protein